MFDDDVWRYTPFGPVPTLVLGVLGVCAMAFVTARQTPAARRAAAGLLILIGLVILAVTARGAPSNPDADFNWHLGASIRSELHNLNRSVGMANVFGNVVMFAPIGWLVAVLVPHWRVIVGVLAGVGFSCAIEIWQTMSGSVGDVDDIVLNGIGALVGATLAVLAQEVSRSTAAPGAGSRAPRSPAPDERSPTRSP